MTAVDARLAGCECIVRDRKGFRGSPIPSHTPEAVNTVLRQGMSGRQLEITVSGDHSATLSSQPRASQTNASPKFPPWLTLWRKSLREILQPRVRMCVVLWRAKQFLEGICISLGCARRAISKQRMLSSPRNWKSGQKIYRSTCFISRLQPSLTRPRVSISCNVALGEPDVLRRTVSTHYST